MSNHDLEDLRAEVLDAVRQLFDSQTSQLASGKAFDPQRLLLTIELITRLLPQTAAEPAPAAEYVGARERLEKMLEAQGRAQQADRDAELEALRAENAALRERASARALPAPPQQKALPSPDAAPAKEKWKPPAHWKREGQPVEPWREWICGDGLSMRRIRHSDWGPI